jgi:hypothetical protein
MRTLPRSIKSLGVALLIVVCGITGCIFIGIPESKVYTLYRSGVFQPTMRIHIATFDADDEQSTEEYNHDNCEQTRGLFQTQPGVGTKYWCEKGRFKQ